MGWTTPTDRAAAYTVTNTDWNVIEDNLTFLYGDSAWTAVGSFSNSWVSNGTAPGYILLGRVVYLRGGVSGGTGGAAAFTLPVGYRPTQQSWFTCVSTTTTTQEVSVTTAGVVAPSANTVACWLNGVTFPVV